MIVAVSSATPRNGELAEQFELLADLLELDGTDGFRLQAYRRAASRIRESTAPVAQLAIEGKATRLGGIGSAIEAKIVEFTETGDMKAFAKVRGHIPLGLVDVMHVPGLGPKTAIRLWEELGVTDFDSLQAAAEAEKIRTLSGLGPKTEEKVLRALSRPAEDVQTGRVLLGRVLPFVQKVVADLRQHPAAVDVSETGSVRRRSETVRDLGVIATAKDPGSLIDAFVSFEWVAEIVAQGDAKATVVTQDGLNFDLRVVPPECFGNLLQHFTGSRDHNIALREEAVRQGLSVSEYGVEIVDKGETMTAASEAELYESLGYHWIPPELREDRGELMAARAHEIPALVELDEIQGDLHLHTSYSDGRHTIDEMVETGRQLGHQYMAICDHAQRLRGGRLEQQVEDIDRLNAEGTLRVLSGIEVDIRADGDLGMSDDVLAARDWVVGSVHSGFDQSRDRLMKRIISAMENPHVDCIGHPTGRKINRRAPYDLDLEGLFRAAVATGTCIEINAQPERLDLSDVNARMAAKAGVRIVVSTDAHRTWELANLQIGVAQARRAWLTAAQVVNTRPWDEIHATLGGGS